MLTSSVRCLLSVLCILLLGPLVHAQSSGQTDQSSAREISLPAEKMQGVLDAIVGAIGQQGQASSLPDGCIRIEKQGDSVELEFRPQQNQLRLGGSPKLIPELVKLTTALANQTAGQATSIVSLSDSGLAALSRDSVFRTGDSSSTTAPNATPAQLPQFQGFRRVTLASALQESAGQQPLQSATGQDGDAAQSEDDKLSGLPLQQFDGVQVEMLPEIDAIILRGRDKQLADLAEIIKQLDEASRQAQPEVEVLLLQHVNSQSLGTLMQTTQQSVLAARQGKVLATALNNPNAILLIGWGDALRIAKELIAKLDQPVPPSSTFSVIPLKHAVASQVQTQLENLFKTRTGLGPVIQSVSDPRTNAIIVHAAPRDLEEIRRLIEQLDIPRGDASQQARVFQIRNSLADDIAASLRLALSGTAADGNLPIELVDEEGHSLARSGTLSNSRITVNARNNTLIVSSAPENLKLIEQLIQQLDAPGMVAKIKIFPIINADAGTMVETLRSLIPSQATNPTAGPQLSSAPEENSLVALRFTVDTRGNNIIAVGSEGDLKIVEALIVRLDESDTLQRKSTVYQLKNAPALDIALAVNEFLRSKRQVEVTTTGSTNPFEQLEREVVVVPEPVQNKLILSATPRYYEEISRLIEQLDQQPPQVMIQVLIAEVDLDNTREFGMELGLQNSVLFDRSVVSGLVNQPGFNFNNQALGNSASAAALASAGQVGGQGLSNFSVGRTNEELGFGGLVLSASSENVSFLLRALQDCRRLEVLSRPQVLTLDNQQAFIQVGQRVPRITTANVTQFGFTTGVTLENVGLILGVTPRISPEGNVVMELDAEKSKIRPADEGIPISVAQDGSVIRSPIVDVITAQATVSAADGETIILGGLISRETLVNHRKVPWLGDIPVIRNLFRYELQQSRRIELLIILTPHIIRNESDMQRLKQAEFARMSWCEADVLDVHGDIHAFGGTAVQSLDSDQWQVVYPDVDPRGKSFGPVEEATPIDPQMSTQPIVVPPPIESIQFRRENKTAQNSQPSQNPPELIQANFTQTQNDNSASYSAQELAPPPAGIGVSNALFRDFGSSSATRSDGDKP